MNSEVLNISPCPVSVCGVLVKPYDSVIIDLPNDFKYNKSILVVNALPTPQEKTVTRDLSKGGQKKKRKTVATTNNKKESE